MIVGSDSLFEYIYRASMDYNYYRDESFIPEFTPGPPDPNVTSLFWPQGGDSDPPSLYDVCGTNQACQYDYSVTSSEQVATATKAAQERWDAVREMSKIGEDSQITKRYFVVVPYVFCAAWVIN